MTAEKILEKHAGRSSVGLLKPTALEAMEEYATSKSKEDNQLLLEEIEKLKKEKAELLKMIEHVELECINRGNFHKLDFYREIKPKLIQYQNGVK